MNHVEKDYEDIELDKQLHDSAIHCTDNPSVDSIINYLASFDS